MHAESGEWIEGTGEIPLGKKDPQGAGSAQTYAQRYHLMAMLGLPPTDDDGESAMERKPPTQALTGGPANAGGVLTEEASKALGQKLRDGLDNQPADPAKLKEWWNSPRVTSAANSLLPHHREHLINLFTSAEKLAADHAKWAARAEALAAALVEQDTAAEWEAA